MSRGTTPHVVVSSLIAGAVATLLTALAGGSAGAAFGFMLLAMLVLGIYWLWPDLRARFHKGRH